MLLKKVIAYGITNLTDARYFAAWGVDYLLFDTSEISIEAINEIMEWVSGPDLLLLFSSSSVGLADEAMIKLQPSAIALSDGSNQLDYLAGHYEFFDYQSLADDTVVITIGDTTYRTDTTPDSTSETGMIILGGMEERPGYKSYEELDDIFDQLLP